MRSGARGFDRFPGREAITALFMSPLMVPHVVLGIAFLRFFSQIGLSGTFTGLMLSHVIVILTLTIPGVILAESFLSFLGIGITEPLISWGLMMRNTQDIQTLGQNAWILAPIAFIVIAVLGFNFLGDGLRDAADPYAAK